MERTAGKFDIIEVLLREFWDDPTVALGLRKVIEHANLAYHASWYEAQKLLKKCGNLHLVFPNISPRKKPRLSLTKRCTLI